MAFEKLWAPVSVQSLIANGTQDGQLQIADAWLLKVKQIILLKSNTQFTKQVEVKRVINKTTFYVGRVGESINDRVDVSAFLVADSGSISSPDAFQPRPKIAENEVIRAVYEEEPTCALRTIMVGRGGQILGADPDSPFYVQLSDGSINIETLNAELRVQLSAKDNDPIAGDVHSSVRIGDGTNEVKVNPDGSFNVVTSSGTAATNKSEYNEVSAVPSATPTLLVTYTAPAGKVSYLKRVVVSGDNIAKYKVKLNGVVMETLRTYFGGDLNAQAEFDSDSGGIPLAVGDVITVEVEHQRPFVADFNGRIQVSEV